MIKSGFVSIIGKPNVGKSTLLNAIVGEKVSIVSYHPQTTRNKINGIFLDGRGQIVFIDTPGIHKSRNQLSDYMLKAIDSAVDGVDCIVYVIAIDKPIDKSDIDRINNYTKINTPTIVVLNKGDVVLIEDIAKAIEDISKKVNNVKAIIPVSARKNKNLDLLVNEIFSVLKEGELLYPEDMYTDKNVRFLVAELIREKAMSLLKEEIPYGIAVEIDKFKEKDTGTVEIYASIICEKEPHKKIILGKNGDMIKKIATAARFEIEKLLDSKCYLDVFVKVKDNWRDQDIELKNLGYDKKDI